MPCTFFSVVVKNPSDFIGGYIGHSEMQTKAILASTVGKVLVIDEVYIYCYRMALAREADVLHRHT
jgi:hypothetical protein